MQVNITQTNEISNPIHVIGIDASGPENLPLNLKELIFSTTKLAAPKRILKDFSNWWKSTKNKNPLPELFSSDKPEKLITWLSLQENKTIILASGDPLWFGIGRCLSETLLVDRLIFHPSPSSLQLAFARLGRSWQDASWISLHGRDPSPLAKCLQKRPKALAILTDPSREGAQEVRQYLRSSGLEQCYSFWICERLGHSQERIYRLNPQDKLKPEPHPLHIVILIAEESSESKELPFFGIDDGIYLQHNDRPGLMTKREIRIQLIADLELPEEGVLWDIGAGVGSVGLESIRLRPKLRLLAIDQRIGSKQLIKDNAKRLSVNPSAIFESEALSLLNSNSFPKDLFIPNRVILGGGGLNREKILKAIITRLTPEGIVVIPLVTLEAASQLISILKKENCKLSINQHQNWRGVSLSMGTRLEPTNPVFIIKGKKY